MHVAAHELRSAVVPIRQPGPGHVEVRDAGRQRVIAVAGELDVTNVGRLTAALRPAAADADDVWVDLTATTFMDSAGVHALIEADVRLRRDGRRLAVAVRPGPVRRVLSLTRADDLLELHEPGVRHRHLRLV